MQYDVKALWQQDKDHFVHPFTDFSDFHQSGCDIIAHSEGAYIYDINDNKYLDGIAGLWCVNIGHGRAELGQVMAEQATKMAYYSPFNNLSNIPAIQLSTKLASLAPSNLNHVFYSCGGSVANDQAIRIVHYYFNQIGKPSKKKIMSRHSGYHGTTYMASTLTGTVGNNEGFDVVNDLVTHISEANCYRMPEGMNEAEYCDYLVKDFETNLSEMGGADQVAAFIAEPIMGAGGVLVAPEGYHKRIFDLCKANDILFISDEVVTAFGRLGHFFASESVFGIQPDIIICAKGITSGYIPLGATLLSDEIYDVIKKPQAKGAVFSTGFTYSGHPVACAVALKNIEIMEREKICENVLAVGPYLEQQLKTLKELSIVGDVRGSHFMMCIESVANKETKELIPYEANVGKRIAQHCQNLGLIVRPIAHLNVLSPPLIWTRDTVDEVVSILRSAIESTIEDLKIDKFI
ncbi:aminotransferase [Psychromonas sp. 14N.309.X.WAT.B.A12]|uniref:aminotransferase n=1 Tax=unclassified Psychromonas TaxID=2614957 RepID=UPI0025AF15A0|nr:aminotransferase [Psychromonas sp. 14N.309.X.WAT.B.A12]MDN2663218.1 aminotransferase [Psychromonas sp. 14N.309.X.WAT.B.A12]